MKPFSACSVKSSVAYALIGSPGRNRWPSPERQATSYISSEDESPLDTPSECDSDTENHQNSPQQSECFSTLAPKQAAQDHASAEFRSILKGFKSSASNNNDDSLTLISDPVEYFTRAAALGKP